jgi:hypothetical protein
MCYHPNLVGSFLLLTLFFPPSHSLFPDRLVSESLSLLTLSLSLLKTLKKKCSFEHTPSPFIFVSVALEHGERKIMKRESGRKERQTERHTGMD